MRMENARRCCCLCKVRLLPDPVLYNYLHSCIFTQSLFCSSERTRYRRRFKVKEIFIRNWMFETTYRISVLSSIVAFWTSVPNERISNYVLEVLVNFVHLGVPWSSFHTKFHRDAILRGRNGKLFCLVRKILDLTARLLVCKAWNMWRCREYSNVPTRYQLLFLIFYRATYGVEQRNMIYDCRSNDQFEIGGKKTCW